MTKCAIISSQPFLFSYSSSSFDEAAGGPSAFVAGGAVAFDVDLVGSAVRAGRFLFLRFEINLFYLAVSFLFISLGVFIDAQDVAAAAAVAECCDALASAFPCIHVNLEDIFPELHRASG